MNRGVVHASQMYDLVVQTGERMVVDVERLACFPMKAVLDAAARGENPWDLSPRRVAIFALGPPASPGNIDPAKVAAIPDEAIRESFGLCAMVGGEAWLVDGNHRADAAWRRKIDFRVLIAHEPEVRQCLVPLELADRCKESGGVLMIGFDGVAYREVRVQ